MPAASWPLTGDGLWCEWTGSGARDALAGQPALFLDRDGVLVEEVDYLHEPEKARLVPGAGRLLAAAKAAGLAAVVVTNQSGIGRGRYGWEAFAATQARILELLLAEGGESARPDLVLACPHHPEGVGSYRLADPPGRKPNPGMILRAGRELNLALRRSWIVGDRARDLEAGKRAGLAGGLHLTVGHGAAPAEREAARALAGPDFLVLSGAEPADALTLLDRMVA